MARIGTSGARWLAMGLALAAGLGLQGCEALNANEEKVFKEERFPEEIQSIPGTLDPPDWLLGTDPVGDQVCEYDPDAVPPEAMDLTDLEVQQVGEAIVAVITFVGDTEAYNEATEDDLPFSLQFWLWDGTYIEIFFTGKHIIKVVNGVAVAEYDLQGNRLEFTITGKPGRRASAFQLADIETVRASTFAYGYPEYSGSCDDEIVIDLSAR